MIYHKGIFQLYVEDIEEGKYYRPSTGDVSLIKGPDDIEEKPTQVLKGLFLDTDSKIHYIITSLKQVRKLSRVKYSIQILALIAISLLFVVSLVSATQNYLLYGFKWNLWITSSFLFVLTYFYSKQVINPVAHDMVGHWINLRTGESNLNGGCKLRK